MKLFAFLVVVFLFVGFFVSTFLRVMADERAASIPASKAEEEQPAESGSVGDAPVQEEKGNAYDQTERFPTDVLEKTKAIAVDFAAAYHTYDAEEPLRYLENSKPFMTEALYSKLKRNLRREPLERTYLTVEETDVTPVVNNSSLVVRWNVIVKGEAESVDGSVSNTEDWYLVSLREAEGEWKVEDVRVNVPN